MARLCQNETSAPEFMSTPDPLDSKTEDQLAPSGEPGGAPPDEDAAFPPEEESSFAEMLDEFEQQHQADTEPGKSLEGTVLEIRGDSVVVDTGMKREGILPRAEVIDKSGELTVKPGDTIPVSVTGRTQDGYAQLSRMRVKRPIDWPSLEAAFAEGAVIGGVVSDTIKGGLRVDVGARAFLPASRSGTRDDEEMQGLVGQEIRCKIIQLDPAKEDVVVDRRVVLEQEAAAEREKAFQAIEEGAVIQGKVSSLTDYGAFVDVGGIDGLLHVADLSWGRVNKPSDVLSPGESVEVKVLKVDVQARRIALGRKQLTPDPWSLVAEKYQAGTRVQGNVVRLAKFGAFVELEPGVDGLIHVSEMSWSRKQVKPSDVVRKGETVEVVILNVNAAERRVALGLKQALGDPWADAAKKFPVGTTVEGTISNLAKFGAFVELGEGVEGMIHVGDITNEKRLEHPSEALAAGQTVRAVVQEVDPGKRRIRLSMKQLEPTAADEYIASHTAGDQVSGRVVDSHGKTAKVELAEGVLASCRVPEKAAPEAEAPQTADKPDLAAMTAMLASRWKEGSLPKVAEDESGLRVGQVLNFRIQSLDAEKRRIEIEPA